MATTGYRVHSSNGSGYRSRFNHACSSHSFYTNGKWFIAAFDGSSDWRIFEWDGSTPASPGDAGTFANPGFEIEHRATSNGVDLFWDESTQKLHVISAHSSSPYYRRWGYNSGTNVFTIEVGSLPTSAGEALGITFGGMQTGSIAVDSNGVIWLAYIDTDDTLKVRYREESGSWTAGSTIESTASTDQSSTSVDIVPWDNGGTLSIAIAYSYGISGGDKWKFAYRADSDSLTSAWTKQDISSSITIDDHVAIRAVVASGDSTSTIIVCGKSSGTNGDANIWRRTPVGSWQSAVVGITDTTRPRIVIDEENDEVYVVGPNNDASPTSFIYAKADLTTTLSFGSEIVYAEDATASNMTTNCAVPSHNVDSGSDLFLAGSNDTSTMNTWWNIIDIAAAVGGVTGKSNPLYGPLGGPLVGVLG